MARILLVDDEPRFRRVVGRIIKEAGHQGTAAENVAQAQQRIEEQTFDLLLSDVKMPGKSGLELIEVVTRKYPNIAVVMITGVDDPAIADLALDHGAYGYLVKPFRKNELLITLNGALRRLELERTRHDRREALEIVVRERTRKLRDAVSDLRDAKQELVLAQEETLHRLSKAAEFRDNETAEHIQRMSQYCALLARRVGTPKDQSETIRLASLMHDVGKIGIPDAILLKPGRLTGGEFDTMKMHSDIGFRILSGSRSQVLDLAATIALTHHEKFDGNGYPRGLSGYEIPLEGRIAAVADVFDALTSQRVYKSAMPVDKALDILTEGRSTHFDPMIIDLFMDSIDDVMQIKERFADRPAGQQTPLVSYLTGSGVWPAVNAKT